MKHPVAVGCLVVVLIVVGIIVLGAVRAVRVVNEMSQISDELREYDSQHPFTPPASEELMADQLDRTLAVRRALARPLTDFVNSMSKDGFFDKIKAGFDIWTKVGRVLVDTLKTQQMSSTEYLWVMDHVIAMTLRGNRADAAPEQKKMYEAYQQVTTVDGEGRGRVEQGQELLERAIVAKVSPTEEALILTRSGEIIASMRAVLGESALAHIQKQIELNRGQAQAPSKGDQNR
jgi:hypothetical protein